MCVAGDILQRLMIVLESSPAQRLALLCIALWGTIMHRGDDGFTQKISDLASAVQSQR